jgi:hypothetical protein
VRRRDFKSEVKDSGSTIAGPWILEFSSAVEAGGMQGVAVKCIDTLQNADWEASRLS